MTQEEALREVLDAFEEARLPYMVVGSTASSYWGIPRSTRDADVVVAMDAAGLDTLLARLGARYYVPEGIARDAVARGSMFNLIHEETLLKVDLIVRRGSAPAFERRTAVPFLGRPAWFATPEDTIVSKLVWHRRGGSDVQLRDCAGVVAVQGDRLDRDYLTRAAADAGVLDLLEKLPVEPA